jgi:signal transduction histidine kinase
MRFMRLVDLWRHTSFRLALGVALFVLATLMLAGGVGYGLMQSQVAVRQDARVTEIFAAIEETGELGDEADLIEAVESRIKASPGRATAYRLVAPHGGILASNIADAAIPDGWSTLPAARLAVAADHSYRVFSGRVGRYSLTVGLSNAEQDVLQADVLGSFGWAALATLVAALAAGMALAARVQARMTVAEAAAARIAQGDLSARLPVTGKGDDLDRISGAMNAALERLASVVEASQEVSSNIAHDLRTPLNRLRIHLMEAAHKAASGGDPEDDLAAALAQGETIDQTFTALLRIAQIEAGARREKFASLDLAALVADVADVYADVAEDAGISLAWDTHGPVWVMGDRELLTQTCANLIENAIRHCPSGTTISCTVQAEGDHAVASVCDTGPGIPVAERDKVLRRLYRLEKSRTTEGTGLGLALVKAVADLHGAGLSLTDAAPGLRVTLRFARIHGVA